MAITTPDVGTGMTVTFSGSAYSAAATSFALTLRSVSWSGISRPSIDTTVMDTVGARTFMPGDLYDPGTLTFDLFMDHDLALTLASTGPFVTQAANTVTLTFGDGITWAASGFITEYSFNNPLEEADTATAVFKLSGAITIT